MASWKPMDPGAFLTGGDESTSGALQIDRSGFPMLSREDRSDGERSMAWSVPAW
ncbi:MAG TPA: hypothetical protein G4O08_12235 [Anaerolineae bacterium]|nr:hypothetical protein [Anaerolineae bacterium]